MSTNRDSGAVRRADLRSLVTRPDDLLERGIDWIAKRSSGKVIVLLAITLYPGVGLALPVALNWTLPNLIAANLLGASLAAALSLGWLMARLEAKDRRHLLEWTSDLRLLTAEEFEWLVGELFRREGWTVRETRHQSSPDGNVDLEISRSRERCLVQCKRWTAWQVGVDDIRAFAGALYRERKQGMGGYFVTLSDFTEQARHEARRMGVTLIDGRELYRRVEGMRRTEQCPVCQQAMVLDRSRHGWWFRCVQPGCPGKRDVAREPGRAVELLTLAPDVPTEPPR